MEETMDSIVRSWHEVKTTEWDLPLMKVSDVIMINAAYVALVLLLRVIMSSDSIPALSLKWMRALYNLTCVALSGYCLYLALSAGLMTSFGYICNSNGGGEAEKAIKWAGYVFYLSKYFEFTDTIIMLLRKKFDQVSFLHVYHHASIACVVYLFLIYVQGCGDEWVPYSLNSFVHVLMYSHYFVTTFGVSAPWKPLLTSMQLTQFLIIFVQSVLCLQLHCGWPDFLNFVQLVYMSTMFGLFGNFFYASYVKNGKKRPKKCD
ncbi:elongation of very long chain fatty acids protein 4-like protein [Diplonema papillatum]|nr:elongation of very long chain fatty acids protein 4-like protein [Diplonema papillatum]